MSRKRNGASPDSGEDRVPPDRAAGQRRAPVHKARRCYALCAVFLWLAAFGGALPQGRAQGVEQDSRVVEGKVLSPQEKPQPNAIVYLENQKTLEVKTYITTADGKYRFGEVSTDADFQVWAEYHGLKSKTRSISSFDSKEQIDFDLQLEPSKQASRP